MKKILFASTALVAFAGAASAEVAISGSAEIGIVGGDVYGDTTQFHTAADVDFDMTGEADNGLSFGASVDLGESTVALDDAASNDNGVSYFVAFGNARLDMGDTDGAVDWALQETALAAGSIDDAETAHAGYNGAYGMDGAYDGQIARFTYTFGDFAAALSTEIDDDGVFDAIWGVGFQYSADFGGTAVGFGIGYQKGDEGASDQSLIDALSAASSVALAGGTNAEIYDEIAATRAYEVVGASVDVTLASGVQFAVNYAESKFGDAGFGAPAGETETYAGIGIGYEMNALAIGLNYGEYTDRFGIDGLNAKGYGLAVAYDLGGGLAVQAGYGYSEIDSNFGLDFDQDQFSLGLAMSF